MFFPLFSENIRLLFLLLLLWLWRPQVVGMPRPWGARQTRTGGCGGWRVPHPGAHSGTGRVQDDGEASGWGATQPMTGGVEWRWRQGGEGTQSVAVQVRTGVAAACSG
jgi:hypothetical protein